MRTAIWVLLLSSTAACSPAQRTVVGGGIAVVGLAVTSAALESMAASCPQQRAPDGSCPSSGGPTSFSRGLPVALGGVGIALLGGVVVATADQRGSSSPTGAAVTDAAPENPAALDKSDAVGMAVAWLVLEGLNDHSGPMKLLDVDEAQSRLSVDGAHAELQNLRVQSSADRTWLTLDVCYEYASEWRVSSLGAAGAACAEYSK